MRAVVGDQLHLHGRVVGQPERTAEVVEVHGMDDSPPYLVRHEDRHESLVFPGPDASVEHPQR